MKKIKKKYDKKKIVCQITYYKNFSKGILNSFNKIFNIKC